MSNDTSRLPEPYLYTLPSKLPEMVIAFTARKSDEQLREKGFQKALDLYIKAMMATIKYMKYRRDGGTKDVKEEDNLSRRWSDASNAIGDYDPNLAHACLFKGMGWTDPQYWDQAEKIGMKISINDMQEALNELRKKRFAAMSDIKIPNWFPIAGVFFLTVTIFFLMFVLIGPGIESDRKTIFNVLIGFCAAASAAFFGGSAIAKGQIPFFADSPISFSAYSGVGTFLTVYLILQYSM